MKLNSVKIIFLLIIALSLSCEYFDFGGMFASSEVNTRFEAKDSLKNFYAPSITDTNNFKFIVISDTHYTDSPKNYIKYIEDNKNVWGVSFIVVTGDITNNGFQTSFDTAENEFSETSLPVYPVIGNHDLYNSGFDIYKNVFGRTIYDFKIGDTHFIMIDTANGTLGTKQKEWLENVLANSGCKNKIVFSHYNLQENVFESETVISFPEEEYYLYDLFEKYSVNYFISGHFHGYLNTEIRGVKYIVISNMAAQSNNHLIISVTNGNLSDTIF
jgi:3',5'-cyclic AMP phosphodiesterase CpdA